MKRIIEIKSESKQLLRIGYLLTTACSYSCRYCPDKLHTGTNKRIDIDGLKEFLLKLRQQKQIILDITGGEATLHPQFVELVKMCRDIDVKTSVGTNASRTLRWFRENSEYVDNWVVTIHPSQHELDLEKIKTISERSFTVVDVMMDPAYWQRSIQWHQELSSVKNIKLVILKIINHWAGANFSTEYTQEQSEYIENNNSLHTFEESRIDQLEDLLNLFDQSNNIGLWNDRTKSTVDPYMLIKQGQNKFKNWNCRAGEEVITLDDNQIVHWANCKALSLGHVSEINLESLKQSVTCPFDSCDCTTDIRTAKSIL